MNISTLRRLYPDTGADVASVYLEEAAVTQDAGTQLPLRWRSLRGVLDEQGADAATLEALDDVLQVDSPGAMLGRGRALIASGGAVLLDEALAMRLSPPFAQDWASWSALPYLTPLLLARDGRVPHMVVVADRIGADIHNYGGRQDDASTVRGEAHPTHKVPGGGWSHRRYQQRVENQWEHNASEVAEQIAHLAYESPPAVIVLAGDVRARTALREHLPSRLRELVVETEHGGRSGGSSADSLREQIDAATAEADAAGHQGLVARFQEEFGQHDRAARGMAATLTALRRAQVDTLLLDPAVTTERRIWTDRIDATLIGDTAAELTDLGAEQPVEERLDSVLTRACVSTDADLLTLSSGQLELPDGVGAVLRYSDASTPTQVAE